MKTITIKKSVHDEGAYCRNCDWESDLFDERRSTQQARRHVAKTGHRVDVYREQHVAVVPKP